MSSSLRPVKHVLTILLGGLAMLVVALACAFLSLRIAIHGREVIVPNLAGLSDADAANAAKDLGLNLTVENRFYSPAVAQNQVLSQSPSPGSRVRRGWQVSVTESLGPQRVSVPDVTAQTERTATVILKSLLLETGTVAHLPAPSPAGIVLAQSPPPNSKGMNGPRVSFLVSDDEDTPEVPAFIMPPIVGLSVSAASLRLAGAGLHISSSQPADQPDQAEAPDPAAAPPLPISAATAIIATQTPPAGHRVTRSDNIRVTLSESP